jgi:hypothetical protein
MKRVWLLVATGAISCIALAIPAMGGGRRRNSMTAGVALAIPASVKARARSRARPGTST